MILVDTSGLLAALFPDQKRHAACAKALLQSKPPRILSPFVLAELDYLICKHAGVEVESSFLEEVARGAYELATFDAADVAEAKKIVDRYGKLAIGLADASIVVLAGRYGTSDVLTLDQRHFRTLKPPGKRQFRILPSDDQSNQ